MKTKLLKITFTWIRIKGRIDGVEASRLASAFNSWEGGNRWKGYSSTPTSALLLCRFQDKKQIPIQETLEIEAETLWGARIWELDYQIKMNLGGSNSKHKIRVNGSSVRDYAIDLERKIIELKKKKTRKPKK